MPPLQRFVIALTGGLQDSKSIPDPSDLVKLYNFSLFRGRFALRAPMEEIHTIGSEDVIIHMMPHLNEIYVLTWNTSGETVNLYSFAYQDPDSGWPAETLRKASVYTGVTTRPTMFLASFSGGTADSPEDRLYICDYDQNEISKYWVQSTTTLSDLSEDFNADNSAEDAYFSLMAPYQFHLWGSGFYSDIGGDPEKLRPEMLRFSQPGLIPNVDPAGGTPSSKEWFTFNHRSVGRRGDKIKALSYAAGNLMVFQAGTTHSVFGYGQDSWATKQLSDHIGAVGPRAATATDTGGLCFFWSHDGPFMTNGTQVIPIGEDIRQHVIDHQADEKISAAYSPDDGMVYFNIYDVNIDKDADPDPEYYLGYDTVREKWCDGSWLKGTGTPVAVPVSCIITATSRDIAEAPGPQGDPTSLAVYNQHQESIDPFRDLVYLSWVSAEFSLDGATYIHRDTSPAFTPDSGNLIKGQMPTFTRFTDGATGTPLASRTDYYYQVRHWRNGTYSGNSNEVSARTWCEPVESLEMASIESGINWRVTVPASATPHCDIELQRAEVASASDLDWYSPATLQDKAPPGIEELADTSNITLGKEYLCRARVVDVNNTGTETESNWTYAPSAVRAGTGVTGSLTLASPTITTLKKISSVRVLSSCTYSNATPGVDYIRVYVNDGSGYPDDDDPNISFVCGRVSGLQGASFYYSCPYSSSVTVRFKAYRMNQGAATSTVTTSSISPCTGVEY